MIGDVYKPSVVDADSLTSIFFRTGISSGLKQLYANFQLVLYMTQKEKVARQILRGLERHNIQFDGIY